MGDDSVREVGCFFGKILEMSCFAFAIFCAISTRSPCEQFILILLLLCLSGCCFIATLILLVENVTLGQQLTFEID